jgi:dihydroflavonol-4-reductase
MIGIKDQIVAITGATGHLGTAIVLLALDRGFKVRALYRNGKPGIEHENLSWIKGDLSVASLELFLASANAIIHCAAKISIHGDADGSVKLTNIGGTKNLMEAARSNPTLRIVHVSSTHAATEFPQDEVYNEERPLKSEDAAAYDFSKAESERIVNEYVQNTNANALIVRPSSMLGPPDLRPSLLGAALLGLYKGELPALTSGGYDFVDVRDVAAACLNAVTMGRAGETYILTGRYYDLHELSQLIHELGGSKPPRIIKITWLLHLLPFVNLYSRITGKAAPFTREGLVTLQNGHNMSHEKAKRELRYNPRNIESSVQDLIEWWKDQNLID